MNNVKPRPLLADCPYCSGTGTDTAVWDRRCGHCNGRGRMARFMAEEILTRWTENGGREDDRVGLAAEARNGTTGAGFGAGADSAGQGRGKNEDEDGGNDGRGGNHGGGQDDDPNPPRPYRLRPAA